MLAQLDLTQQLVLAAEPCPGMQQAPGSCQLFPWPYPMVSCVGASGVVCLSLACFPALVVFSLFCNTSVISVETVHRTLGVIPANHLEWVYLSCRLNRAAALADCVLQPQRRVIDPSPARSLHSLAQSCRLSRVMWGWLASCTPCGWAPGGLSHAGACCVRASDC